MFRLDSMSLVKPSSASCVIGALAPNSREFRSAAAKFSSGTVTVVSCACATTGRQRLIASKTTNKFAKYFIFISP